MADLCTSCAGFGTWTHRLERGSKKKGSTWDVVADLPDDILIDILSRLPIKSLCRCKLVSKCWRNLISHHEHRKKLPQPLAGFFYNSITKRYLESVCYFTVTGAVVDPFIDPSLLFLTEYKNIIIKDSCNGLLLCHGWKPTDPVTMNSIVCNPATEKWVVVPDSGCSSLVEITHLGFDPSVSSHFYVFEFIPDDFWYIDDADRYVDGRIEVVAVHSSRTGVWSLNKDDVSPLRIGMHCDSKSVFLNGVLHLATFYHMVLAIDVEGKILRGITLPKSINCDNRPVNVYLSQGHLHLACPVFDEASDDCSLSVWVLEDYNSENWTLKYNVNPLHLFGADYSKVRDVFSVISIHPEHDMIFIVRGLGKNKTLVSYEMDHMRLRFISQLGWYGLADYYPLPRTPYPYVPLFSESLAEK